MELKTLKTVHESQIDFSSEQLKNQFHDILRLAESIAEIIRDKLETGSNDNFVSFAVELNNIVQGNVRNMRFDLVARLIKEISYSQGILEGINAVIADNQDTGAITVDED